jgi:type III restriction enzyme
MLTLKAYQERCLETLETYFRKVRELDQLNQYGAGVAFIEMAERAYREAPGLTFRPYVCVRVPTGGGKTLLACHAVGIAAREHVERDHTLVLWLVPSNAIKEQTLAALRNVGHPYRQALDQRFEGRVRVMDLGEALYLTRADLDGATCVVVSTLQALRVEDTEGRKVYESAGALDHHFSGLSPVAAALLEKDENGVVPHSLANVLRLRYPVVVMDEAHNARTRLSFETLVRFKPRCILEFTATPQTLHAPDRGEFASNVLVQVSAAELKAEQMVKLPIKLRTRADWKEVLADAVAKQRELEALAVVEERETGEHIRPIVLLQAQAKSKLRQTLTVEVVKEALQTDFRIPVEQISIATGETREIDNVNLSARECPVRFILTVQALKEGWDCPFAYILCSLGESHSGTAVEQILGRVLRLPHAHRKVHAELNVAHAFAASASFVTTAESLRDALVENGFQKLEARDLIQADPAPLQTTMNDGLFSSVSAVVTEAPDLSRLGTAMEGVVSYDAERSTLSMTSSVQVAHVEAIQACFSEPANKAVVERLVRKVKGLPEVATAPREPIRVPALVIRGTDNEIELLDRAHAVGDDWNLAACDPSMTEEVFPSTAPTGSAGVVDVSDATGRLLIESDALPDTLPLALPGGEKGWTLPALVAWIDRQFFHPDVPQARSQLFLHAVMARLMEGRGLTLEQLARQKYRLARAIERRVSDLRAEHAREAFQTLLSGLGPAIVEVSAERVFTLDEEHYAPSSLFEGAYRFKKHAFPRVGELASEGEELSCAITLDRMPEVDLWVRNLAKRVDTSFWLPTSTDRFYPDFVARLNDGRILAVEYKGEHLWSADDAKEKRVVGDLWAQRSHGTCLFVMPKGPDWEAIRTAVAIR